MNLGMEWLDEDTKAVWEWLDKRRRKPHAGVVSKKGSGYFQVTLKPNQIVCSALMIEKEIKVPRQRVKRRLVGLKRIGLLDYEMDNHYTIVTFTKEATTSEENGI